MQSAKSSRGFTTAKVNCRIEWFFDGGFVWVLNNGDYPRVRIDDGLDGDKQTVIAQSDEGARAMDRGQVMRRDWIARGSEPTIEEAVTAPAEAILAEGPSAFSKWWREWQAEA